MTDRTSVNEEYLIEGDVAVITLYSDGEIDSLEFKLSYEVTAGGPRYFGEHYVLESSSFIYYSLYPWRLLYANDELSTVVHTGTPDLRTTSLFSGYFQDDCTKDYMLVYEFVSDRPVPYWNLTDRFV